MKPFVVSCDSHVIEPSALWREGLPERFKKFAFTTSKDDKYVNFKMGDTVLHKMQVADGRSAEMADADEHKRCGGFNLDLRIADLAKDGISAEVVYPSMGLLTGLLDDPELELACVQVYNNWAIEHFKRHSGMFAVTAVLPVRSIDNAVREAKRVAALGYTSVMMPINMPDCMPAYNTDQWDPLWAVLQEARLVVNLHLGTGPQEYITRRGPGAAAMNYTRLAFPLMETVGVLCCGGAFDRFPGLTAVCVEAGAWWVAGLGERMDEGYNQHHFYVTPKLSRKPSEILYSQFKASMQWDKSAISNRHITGTDCLMFASDYPHMEGTFPYSPDVVSKLFDAAPGVTEQEKAAILGVTAARLYGLSVPAGL